jgi:hypothetical protein
MRRKLLDVAVEDASLTVQGVGQVVVRVMRDKRTGRTRATVLPTQPTLYFVRGGIS